ncbi:hypothetical protein ENU1_172690 [Entamoeba nuttalli P19]|uniref:Uncharacterized protein n=1 Tax=Entamoeba nuttalli (strain P19) TaxID=1076696 RepID=K2GWS9_ENTNP|nr:hypothetical protein ENU1_172690 [Entamoeba nuttalli P19]EKE38237.1 hypothetical protein ENU1_172690 [Entamoeba nuttalli P19]|eukprot:XP_008859432.1 hypothetical protein ENU1_172690 [Entamoeba nuttalli P19]
MSKPVFNNTDSTPISKDSQGKPLQLCLCPLCINGIPNYNDTKTDLISWIYIIRIILFSLTKLYPQTEYFTLKKDIYGFVADHWYTFSTLKQLLIFLLVLTNPSKWKKSFLDALSHSPYFESGYSAYKTTGYWKLRVKDNPWLGNLQPKAINVIYSADDIIPCQQKPIVVMSLSTKKRMVDLKDNFHEIQMRLRNSYIKIYEYTQSMLEKCDFELQRNISYDMKMQLLAKVETFKNLRMGVYFLMKTLNENETSYKQSQSCRNHYSGCLFFNVILN